MAFKLPTWHIFPGCCLRNERHLLLINTTVWLLSPLRFFNTDLSIKISWNLVRALRVADPKEIWAGIGEEELQNNCTNKNKFLSIRYRSLPQFLKIDFVHSDPNLKKLESLSSTCLNTYTLIFLSRAKNIHVLNLKNLIWISDPDSRKNEVFH